MSTGSEYFRLFADEAIACAREATTAKSQSHYLAMAAMWDRAAVKQQRDDKVIQISESRDTVESSPRAGPRHEYFF